MSEACQEAMKEGKIQDLSGRKKKMSKYEKLFTPGKGLLEHHKQELYKSGLSDKTIEDLSSKSNLTNDGILFPIWDIKKENQKGFRVRLDNSAIEINEYPASEGETPKYRPSPDLGNVFFYPHLTSVKPWDEIAKDITISIFITEGEKKAALLCQYGYACIGLFGVNNWVRKEKRKVKDKDGKEEEKEISVPIDCFDDIVWKGRIIYVVYDSDKYKNIKVLVAEAKLWKHLKDLGADVRIINLPCDKEAKGIDDFFVKHGGSNE